MISIGNGTVLWECIEGGSARGRLSKRSMMIILCAGKMFYSETAVCVRGIQDISSLNKRMQGIRVFLSLERELPFHARHNSGR